MMNRAHNRFDCVVAGGGLLGLLTVRGLAGEGLSVCLLERGELCRESSWAGGGILSPLVPWEYPDAVSELVHRSRQVYPQLAEELHSRTGIDPEWTCSGLLLEGVSLTERIERWASRFHCALETADAESLRHDEPALGDVPAHSLLLPDVAQIRNPRLCKGLAQLLYQQGVEIRQQRTVDRLIVERGRVQGVQAGGDTVLAGHVVITCGAWSPGLLPATGLSLPVRPVRGQMLQFGTVPGLLHRIVLRDGYYLIPRRDGLVLAGSTLEETGFRKEVTAAGFQELRQAALNILPGLADYAVINHWSGLRPGSPTGVPFICEHPEISGLYLNTGHYRNGVAMGPASAELLVDLLLGRAGFADPAPYRLPA